MLMMSLIVGIVLTVFTLWLTLVTISKGYSFKHTIDPLEEDGEVREFTGNGKRL
ncbi:MAG TPA: YtzI protein [Pseudogracilibacillus sp.]|nr:YtzI protein [Pseudogracilibacillus sp.]